MSGNICSGRWERLCQVALGATLALILVGLDRAAAEVADSAANGFTLRETAHLDAPPDAVYAALTKPSKWWSSDHTFSHNASNLTLDARAGGCWCESLPGGGSVLHLTVVMAAPGKMLRLRGALGPFQAMAVDGAMVWTLSPAASGTDLTLTYSIAGYTKDGFEQISKAADGVLADQVARLKTFVETGSPEAVASKE